MAITFANASIVGANPYSIFIDLNNTVYVTASRANSIQEWAEGSQLPTRSLSCTPCDNFGLLVTNDGDIYLDNGRFGRVELWRMNASNRTVAIYVTDPCYGLFIDRNGSLYCSVPNLNKIIKNYADSGPNVTFVIAGNGTAGSSGDLLYAPAGIFVDNSFRLYVADAANHRIQIFLPGQRNGSTLFGNETAGGITLYQPMAVVLDGDGYLFIVDYGNHRIIGSGPTGLRCIAGCSGAGSGANQLRYPTTMAFDSHGNLFVADYFNSRIQKFLLINNTCGTCLSPFTSDHHKNEIADFEQVLDQFLFLQLLVTINPSSLRAPTGIRMRSHLLTTQPSVEIRLVSSSMLVIRSTPRIDKVYSFVSGHTAILLRVEHSPTT